MNNHLYLKQHVEDVFNKVSLTEDDVKSVIYSLALDMPEFWALIDCKHNSRYHKYNLLWHTIDVVMYVKSKSPHDMILIWAALLHDIGKPPVETVGKDGYNHYYGHPKVSAELTEVILGRLGYEPDFISNVKELVAKHDECPDKYKKVSKLRNFVADISTKQLDRWIILKEGDIQSHKDSIDDAGKFKVTASILKRLKQIDLETLTDEVIESSIMN